MRPNQYISKSDCTQPAYPASTVFFSARRLSQIRITEINKEATFVNKLKTCSNYANRLLTSNSCAIARNVLTLIITFILSPQVQAQKLGDQVSGQPKAQQSPSTALIRKQASPQDRLMWREKRRQGMM